MTRKNSHTGLEILGVTVILVILCVAVLVYVPSLQAPKQDLIAVSNVNLAPQGNETVDAKWTGSYWTIAATTNMQDQFDAITLGNSSSDSADTSSADTIGQYTVVPQDTITITITPQQPYWTRSLNVAAYTLYPTVETYVQNKITNAASWNTGTEAQAVSVPVWTWGQSYWTAHTPFTITVLKNGVLWANEAVDTGGKTEAVQIVDPNDASQWITLNNVGVLSTSYQSPPVLPDVAMLGPSEIFSDPNAVANIVNYYSGSDYTYSDYWFGGGTHYVDAGAIDTGTGTTGIEQSNPGTVQIGQPGSSPGLYYRSYEDLLGASNEPLDNRVFPGSQAITSFVLKPKTTLLIAYENSAFYGPSKIPISRLPTKKAGQNHRHVI
jgi:hypothetical protein